MANSRNAFARVLIIAGLCWIGLVGIGFLAGVAIALFDFLTGRPGGEGVVMAPVVFIFCIMLCLPGGAMLGIGWLLRRHRRISK